MASDRVLLRFPERAACKAGSEDSECSGAGFWEPRLAELEFTLQLELMLYSGATRSGNVAAHAFNSAAGWPYSARWVKRPASRVAATGMLRS
ncbi:hypothetical protein GCM10011359_19760 [Nesterenkonia alkaliphila]|nr:hypothetical protein GCM10011359_19760 [Nesterenkonia alkaliphila]